MECVHSISEIWNWIHWLVWGFIANIHGNGVFVIYFWTSHLSGQSRFQEALRKTVNCTSCFCGDGTLREGTQTCHREDTVYPPCKDLSVKLAAWREEAAFRGKAQLFIPSTLTRVKLATVESHCPDYWSKTNWVSRAPSNDSMNSCRHPGLNMLLSYAKRLFYLSQSTALAIMAHYRSDFQLSEPSGNF